MEPPYYAVIFSSQRTEGDQGYAAMADQMEALARQQPGFLGIDSARGADGFGITVSYWTSEAAIAAWKAHVDHQAARELGRDRWYAHFDVRVARVERAYGRVAGHDGSCPARPVETCPLEIRVDRELTHPQILALLQEHLAGMHAESPLESVHALDLDGLRRPDITFLTARRRTPDARPGDDGELVAMGALKELEPTTASAGGHGELKSMRTSARHLRQGAAQAILTELLNLARQRGYARVSLETGSTPAFEPAIAMYRRFGFVECGPFGEYPEDPFSRFLTLPLNRP